MTMRTASPTLLAALIGLLVMLPVPGDAATPASPGKTMAAPNTSVSASLESFDASTRYRLDNYSVLIPSLFSVPKGVNPGETPKKGVSSYRATYKEDHFFSIKGPKNLTTDADIQKALLDIKQRIMSADPSGVIHSESTGSVQGNPFLEFVLQGKKNAVRMRVVAVRPATLYQFMFYTHDAPKVKSTWVNRYYDSISFNL